MRFFYNVDSNMIGAQGCACDVAGMCPTISHKQCGASVTSGRYERPTWNRNVSNNEGSVLLYHAVLKEKISAKH